MKKYLMLFILFSYFKLSAQDKPAKYHYFYTFSAFASGNYFTSFSDENSMAFSFGTSITFRYYSHNYNEKKEQRKTRGYLFHYQPSLLFSPSEIRTFLRNNFLYSILFSNRRTGPFAGFDYDILNAGFGFKNEFIIGGSQQVGIVVNLVLHPKNFKRFIKGFHLQAGAGYYFELNKSSGAKNQLMLELSFRYYLKKIPVGGF